MSSSPLQQLLRLFYRYEVRVILCLRDGTIAGYCQKSDIEELMSDLSSAQTTRRPPVIAVENLEGLLELHQQEGFLTDTGRFLPAVNESWEEEELLNRAQIIQTWEKPRISITRPRQSPPEAPSVMPEVTTKPPVLKQKPAPGAPKKPSVEPSKSLHAPQELSTLALEALSIPMIALDTRGNLLFYNHEWNEFFDKDFDIMALMKTAKNRMAEMAFAGELEVDSLLEIDDFTPGLPIRMKTIRNDQKSPPEVIGYIFWVETRAKARAGDPRSEPPKSTPKPQIKTARKPDGQPHDIESSPAKAAPEKNNDSKRFLGRTLPEILEEEERLVLTWAMQEAGNNQSNAAMLLGIPRQTFAYRYKKLFGK